MKISAAQLDRWCMAAVLGIALLVGVMTARVLTQQRERLRTEDEAAIEQAAELQSAQAQLQALRPILAKAKQQNQALSARMTYGDIGAFLERLDHVSKTNGVTVNSMQPQDPTRLQGLIKTPVRLEVTGSFFEIYALLRQIERLDQVVTITQLNLSRSATESDCQAAMLIDLFHRPTTDGTK